MPKQQLENNAKNSADQRATLDQRQRTMADALKERANSGHASQQRDLKEQQDKLAKNCTPADAPKLASIFAEQKKELELRQSTELSFLNAALDTSNRIQKDFPNGTKQAEDILKLAADLNGVLAQQGEKRKDDLLDHIEKTLAIEEAGGRTKELDHLADEQRLSMARTHIEETAVMERLERQEMATRDSLKSGNDATLAQKERERQDALKENLLSKDQTDQMTAAITAATDNENVKALLSREVLQRLANETMVPGSTLLDLKDEPKQRAAMDRAKGAIAEEIAFAQISEIIQLENEKRADDKKLFLLRGDQIRDSAGGKLSDGLIVWEDKEKKLHLWEALEVKSGIPAASELRTEKLDKHEAREAAREERRKYGRAEERDLESKEKNEHRIRNSGSGQMNATEERLRILALDEGGRVRLDDKIREMTIDDSRKSEYGKLVRAYVTDDALERDKDVHRLGISSGDLKALTNAFFEELRRRENQA